MTSYWRERNVLELGTWDTTAINTDYIIGPLDLEQATGFSLQIVDVSTVAGDPVAGTLDLSISNDGVNFVATTVGTVTKTAGDKSKMFSGYNWNSRYIRYVFRTSATGGGAGYKLKAVLCIKNAAELSQN